MRPGHLIGHAKRTVKHGGASRPRQTELKRAVSAAYYALFHALCLYIANLWIGTKPDSRGKDAWQQAYRTLEHGKTKAACLRIKDSKKFTQLLRYVAEIFLELLRARHRADYDSLSRFSRIEAMRYIEAAELAIQLLKDADKIDKLAFVTYLALPHRKD